MRAVLFISGLLMCLQVIAQGQCGDEMVRQIQAGNVKNFEDEVKRQNERIRDYVQSRVSGHSERSSAATTPSNYVIPVVFHVVHPAGQAVGTGANVSYGQILSQLDALNAAFARNYPAYNNQSHPSYAQNTNISFCLARIPAPLSASFSVQGSVTEYGVRRYASSAVSNHELSITGAAALYALTHPATSYFPPASYLNIWIVSSISSPGSAGTVMGYAPLPLLGSFPLDGIVMRGDMIGDNSTGNTFPLGFGLQQGKVLAHEVGHYLNLRHIFESGCAGANPAGATTDACDLYGDCICDTEPSTTQNIGCTQQIPNTCAANYVVGTTTLDMIENYMSYADDDCMNTFTSDQTQRMHAQLNMGRQTLWQYVNLGLTGVMGPGGCLAPLLYTDINGSITGNCINNPIAFQTPTIGNTATGFTWTAPGSSSLMASGNSVTVTYSSPGYHKLFLLVSDGTQTLSDSIGIVVTSCALDSLKRNRGHWVFGDYCHLDFSSGVPIAVNDVAFASTQSCFEVAVSMSDSAGNLLFYSNGYTLWDETHTPINTGPLFGWGLSSPSSPSPYDGSSVSGFVSAPLPGQPGKYLLACVKPFEIRYNQAPLFDRISTVVYDAVQKTVTPFQQYTHPAITYTGWGVSESMCITPHCNGKDLWLLTRGMSPAMQQVFYAFLINENGVNSTQLPVISGPYPQSLLTSISDFKMNPAGDRLACKAQSGAIVYIYDFDPASGQVLNPVQLPSSNTGTSCLGCFGVSFSPDGQFVYNFLGAAGIDQIDMSNNTLVKTIVPSGFWPELVAYTEIGPDNNIYFPGYSGLNSVLGQITNPNSAQSSTAASFVTFTNVPGSTPNISLLNYMQAPMPPYVPPLMSTRNSCSAFSFSVHPCWSIYTSSWNFGDGSSPVSGSTVAHSYTANGIYTVTLTLSYNGQAIPVFQQTVEVTGQGALAISGPTVICAGSPYLNTYHAGQLNGYNYNWTVTNAVIAGPSSISAVQVAPQSPGTITLSVLLSTGNCSTSASRTVMVKNAPSVSLTASAGTICADAVLQLNGLPPGGVYGGQATGSVFAPTVPGIHHLSYTFTDADGCYGNAALNVYVENCLSLSSDRIKRVSVYPNPVSGQLYVNSEAAVCTLELCNALGQVIRRHAFYSPVDLSELPSGVYHLRLEDAEGRSHQKKLIKF